MTYVRKMEHAKACKLCGEKPMAFNSRGTWRLVCLNDNCGQVTTMTDTILNRVLKAWNAAQEVAP